MFTNRYLYACSQLHNRILILTRSIDSPITAFNPEAPILDLLLHCRLPHLLRPRGRRGRHPPLRRGAAPAAVAEHVAAAAGGAAHVDAPVLVQEVPEFWIEVELLDGAEESLVKDILLAEADCNGDGLIFSAFRSFVLLH